MLISAKIKKLLIEYELMRRLISKHVEKIEKTEDGNYHIFLDKDDVEFANFVQDTITKDTKTFGDVCQEYIGDEDSGLPEFRISFAGLQAVVVILVLVVSLMRELLFFINIAG